MRNVSHAGVLAYRLTESRVEFLLVTTRSTRRWSIPKGHCGDAGNARETALREAFEEAGVEGLVARRPIGTFCHVKRGSPGEGECWVVVYPMRVARQAPDWPEKGERRMVWASVREAAGLVDLELSTLMLSFARTLEAGKSGGRPATKENRRLSQPAE